MHNFNCYCWLFGNLKLWYCSTICQLSILILTSQPVPVHRQQAVKHKTTSGDCSEETTECLHILGRVGCACRHQRCWYSKTLTRKIYSCLELIAECTLPCQKPEIEESCMLCPVLQAKCITCAISSTRNMQNILLFLQKQYGLVLLALILSLRIKSLSYDVRINYAHNSKTICN